MLAVIFLTILIIICMGWYLESKLTKEERADRNQVSAVMNCIREYTEGIDKKYNNPDTVSNLEDDKYSNVVKTCNEVFGKQE